MSSASTTTKTTTRVSVLMGVYNCASTVDQAIQSILSQTFEDWEFIICDDCSSDGTLQIINRYAEADVDKRITILNNSENRGLSYSLNRCLAVAKGEYCARMDGDDLCQRNRFEKQVAFLDSNPQVAFVSTRMDRFDENGKYALKSTNLIEWPQKKDLIKGSPFCHAPVMIRKKAYEEVKGYRDIKATRGVEDYDLWFRLYEKGHVGCNLDEALYSMFDGHAAGSRRTWRRRKNEAWVRLSGYKALKICPIYWIYALKPLVLGLMPQWLYKRLRKKS